ncbi:hypothetical protein PHPALM_30225 [Phytophthora palmivora]|uniref:Uncharacterized protein n=1 Tax=Phytophthora palmivora TaxID=4796 RepID=A0A2P4X5P6_9STRA|nr:hypothetical protein PHPALM_30225 [Phytophthora palmivora]
MAKDISADLLEEAIAAADIDSEDEESVAEENLRKRTRNPDAVDFLAADDLAAEPTVANLDADEQKSETDELEAYHVDTAEDFDTTAATAADPEEEGVATAGDDRRKSNRGRKRKQRARNSSGQDYIAGRTRSKIRGRLPRNAETGFDVGQRMNEAIELAKKVEAEVNQADAAKRANRTDVNLYEGVSNRNLKNLNVNCAESRTKKMKRGESMSLQHEEEEELIVLSLEVPGCCRYQLKEPWWNVVDGSTERALGVTCWNSKLNVWEIDLTRECQSECGLISETSSSSGVTGECAQNKKQAPAEQDNDQEAKPATQQKDGPVTKEEDAAVMP